MRFQNSEDGRNCSLSTPVPETQPINPVFQKFMSRWCGILKGRNSVSEPRKTGFTVQQSILDQNFEDASSEFSEICLGEIKVAAVTSNIGGVHRADRTENAKAAARGSVADPQTGNHFLERNRSSRTEHKPVDLADRPRDAYHIREVNEQVDELDLNLEHRLPRPPFRWGGFVEVIGCRFNHGNVSHFLLFTNA